MASCAVSDAGAQQTPADTTCNQKSKLQFDMNSETDMASYNVYYKPAAGVTNADPVLANIVHDTTTVTTDTSGQQVITSNVFAPLVEGDVYFAVSALDKTGNESILSTEIGCKYDTIPGQPTGIIIQLEFTPAP